MSEELSAFLSGWLGLHPGEYSPAELQTAAAVLVARLGLREMRRWHWRLLDRILDSG